MTEQLCHPELRAPSSSSPRSNPFPKLPTELRLRIWDLALADIPPRTVTNRPKIKGNTIPSLLHVNQEARGVALKRYRRHDKIYTLRGLHRLSEEASYAWFIDYDSDSVFLNYLQPLGLSMLPLYYMVPRDFSGVMSCLEGAARVQKLTVDFVAFEAGVDPPNGYYEEKWSEVWLKVLESCPLFTELNLLVAATRYGSLAGITQLEGRHISVLRAQWRVAVANLEGRKIVVKLNGEEVGEEYESWLRQLPAEGI